MKKKLIFKAFYVIRIIKNKKQKSTKTELNSYGGEILFDNEITSKYYEGNISYVNILAPYVLAPYDQWQIPVDKYGLFFSQNERIKFYLLKITKTKYIDQFNSGYLPQ